MTKSNKNEQRANQDESMRLTLDGKPFAPENYLDKTRRVIRYLEAIPFGHLEWTREVSEATGVNLFGGAGRAHPELRSRRVRAARGLLWGSLATIREVQRLLAIDAANAPGLGLMNAGS